jgi:hypothetical protein
MAKRRFLQIFPLKSPLKDAPFTPLVVPRCFDNFHFYSKIDNILFAQACISPGSSILSQISSGTGRGGIVRNIS